MQKHISREANRLISDKSRGKKCLKFSDKSMGKKCLKLENLDYLCQKWTDRGSHCFHHINCWTDSFLQALGIDLLKSIILLYFTKPHHNWFLNPCTNIDKREQSKRIQLLRQQLVVEECLPSKIQLHQEQRQSVPCPIKPNLLNRKSTQESNNSS